MSSQVIVITVSGEMDQRLRGEFEDLDIIAEHGVTRLLLVSTDASVLHGVLHRIDRFGLQLLDVHQVG